MKWLNDLMERPVLFAGILAAAVVLITTLVLVTARVQTRICARSNPEVCLYRHQDCETRTYTTMTSDGHVETGTTQECGPVYWETHP